MPFDLLWFGPSMLLLGSIPDDEAFSWKTALYILFAFGLVLLNGFFVLAEFAMVKALARSAALKSCIVAATCGPGARQGN